LEALFDTVWHLPKVESVGMKNGSDNASHQNTNRCLNIEHHRHGESHGENHGIRGIRDCGLPKNDTGRPHQTDRRRIDSLQDRLKVGVVPQSRPKWNHGENENDSRSKQAAVGHERSRNALVDGAEIGGEIEERTWHTLREPQTLQELVIGHPVGHHFVLKHREDDLAAPENLRASGGRKGRASSE